VDHHERAIENLENMLKNFSNNNVSEFPKIEQEPAEWLESAPPAENADGTTSWTDNAAETANAVSAEWEDVNQATSETAPSAPSSKEGGKPTGEGTAAKIIEPETKSYEDYLKEQEKKRTELKELLANKQISAPTTRQVVIDKSETGRYVDAQKEADKPKEEKVKKVKEPKEGGEKKKSAPKQVPLHEIFKIEQPSGYNRRRNYNEFRDSQEGGAGEGENQGNDQGGENRGRGRGRRGGRGGGERGGRNARSGRQSNRAFNNNNNNNRGNGGNVLPSQPEDWPALVH